MRTREKENQDSINQQAKIQKFGKREQLNNGPLMLRSSNIGRKSNMQFPYHHEKIWKRVCKNSNHPTIHDLKTISLYPKPDGDPLDLWNILEEWKKEESVEKIDSSKNVWSVLNDIDESDGPPNNNETDMMNEKEQLDPKNQNIHLLQQPDLNSVIRNLGLPDACSEDRTTPARQ